MMSLTCPLPLGFCDFSAFSGSTADYLLKETLAASASAFFNDCQNCGVLITVVITPPLDDVNADRTTRSFAEANSNNWLTRWVNSLMSVIALPSEAIPSD